MRYCPERCQWSQGWWQVGISHWTQEGCQLDWLTVSQNSNFLFILWFEKYNMQSIFKCVFMSLNVLNWPCKNWRHYGLNIMTSWWCCPLLLHPQTIVKTPSYCSVLSWHSLTILTLYLSGGEEQLADQNKTEVKSVIDYIIIEKDEEQLIQDNIVDKAESTKIQGANKSDQNPICLALRMPYRAEKRL